MNEITITIKGIEELTRAVQVLAASLTGKQGAFTTQTPQAPPVGYSQETASASIMPVLPVSTVPAHPIPVQQPVPVQPAPPQVPTTVAPVQYTFDQLAVTLSNLCSNMGKQQEVHALLERFGVQALFDLPKERYGEFATAMREIGGVI